TLFADYEQRLVRERLAAPARFGTAARERATAFKPGFVIFPAPLVLTVTQQEQPVTRPEAGVVRLCCEDLLEQGSRPRELTARRQPSRQSGLRFAQIGEVAQQLLIFVLGFGQPVQCEIQIRELQSY